MPAAFRILDNDYRRAHQAESRLRACMKAYGLEGRVSQVLEHLELSRAGLSGLPALEFNGIILCQGQDLTEELLDDVCLRLSIAKKRIEANKEE